MLSDRQPLVYQDVGFGAFDGIPEPPGGHVHDAFELSAFEGGSVTMRYGGRTVMVGPNRLVAHWGMLPHQMASREAGTRVVGLHIPLVWVLHWALPGDLLNRLLNLEVLIEPVRHAPCGDLALLRDWYRLLGERGAGPADIVLAEARARFLRLACRSAGKPAPAPLPHREPIAFDRALRSIVQHFREPLRLREVAATAGISERHLSRLFMEYTGQTVNGYITKLRLSHAQRMLMGGEAKVIDILYEAGFSCSTQFYRLFKARTGMTPARYRRVNPRPSFSPSTVGRKPL